MGYLKGKVAVITGASRGIGKAVALRFPREGARVAVNYNRSVQEAEEVVRTICDGGGEAFAVQADVALKSDVHRMVERVVARWGTIDILMNNAGVALDASAEHMTEEEWDRVVDVSLKGTFLCTQAIIPYMRQKGGKVINVSAASAIRGRKNGVNFCAAKAGVIALTKCFPPRVGTGGSGELSFARIYRDGRGDHPFWPRRSPGERTSVKGNPF